MARIYQDARDRSSEMAYNGYVNIVTDDHDSSRSFLK